MSMQSYAIKARVALKSVRPKILAGLYQSAGYRVQNASQGTNLRTSEDERSAKRTRNAPTKLLPDKGPFEGMTTSETPLRCNSRAKRGSEQFKFPHTLALLQQSKAGHTLSQREPTN